MEAITREEKLMDGQYVEPITRAEKILAGEDLDTVTRREYFLKKYRGGGGDISVVQLSVTENGVYTAPSGKAYSPVNVEVPTPENAYFLKSVAGLPSDIASFSDGSDMPLKTLQVSIEPVQSGSGEPSPSNERPISGHTSCNVTRCGVNVWDEEFENAVLNSDGTTTPNSGRRTTKNYVSIVPTKKYTMRIPISGRGRGAFYDANHDLVSYYSDFPKTGENDVFPNNGAIITSGGGDYYFEFIVPENARYLKYSAPGSTIEGTSINYPSTDTSYHAYNGNAYTITFTDGTNPLTVYGGTLDVTSGVLTVDRYKVKLSDVSDWTNNVAFDNTFNGEGSVLYNRARNVDWDSKCACDSYKGYSNLDVSSQTSGIALANSTSAYDNVATRIYVKDTRFSSYTDFVQSLQTNDIEVVFPLATPQTYSLTPTAVASILGVNNVFADTGEVNEVQYLSREV